MNITWSLRSLLHIVLRFFIPEVRVCLHLTPELSITRKGSFLVTLPSYTRGELRFPLIGPKGKETSLKRTLFHFEERVWDKERSIHQKDCTLLDTVPTHSAKMRGKRTSPEILSHVLFRTTS